MDNYRFNPLTGVLDITGVDEVKTKQIIAAATAPMVFAGTVSVVPNPPSETDVIVLHTVNSELIDDSKVTPDETRLNAIDVEAGWVFVVYQGGTAFGLGALNAGDQILICGPTVEGALDAVVLNNIVPLGYQFIGVADPTTQDTIVDVNVKCAWITATAGTYTGLGNIVVDDNELAVITRTPSGGVGIFAKTSLGKYVLTSDIADDLTTDDAKKVLSAKQGKVLDGGIRQLDQKKLDNSTNENTFYIVDNYGRVIAKIDADGIHSTDYSYKDSEDSLADEQGNVSLISKLASLLNSITSEATTRAEAVGALSSSKLDAEFDGSAFYFTDSDGYIICKIDAAGVHAPNIGESTAVDKYKVACMVLGENYYPSAKPTRDSKGFVTSMNVVFETGVSGTIAFTYDITETRKKGNISSISVAYGTDSYAITITRDNSGNVNTVSVE